ncbi:MAG: 4-hydroxythreonine-4-phosphate dehydrogenase PdxA [Ignavibacteriae bacterium HGW-Ignavibacteriae-2]|jgi:4-hydroxythreonine-4-phosphate dehydrogenase|nr:MAG: 4-hydroxythreonine-4-phosphate dehydrogenase PdxA [Ignavibacteriae bacterium HGW-Ignavibacteriae-2]
MTRYIITCGDINGIGPEISIKLIRDTKLNKNEQFIFVCPSKVFNSISKKSEINLAYAEINSIDKIEGITNPLILLDIGQFNLSPGKPTLASGKASVKALRFASQIISKGLSLTVITAPISKEAVSKAGFDFPGHTEYFASVSTTGNYLMMFLSKKLRSALLTIHEPLAKVPKMLTEKLLLNKLSILNESLIHDFKIPKPKIAILGLNPHAGEKGILGSEEEKVIKPVLKKLGNSFIGPFVPDAFFAKKLYKDYDCVVGMYHDQVLIPFKMLDFYGGVNYTAGLNFVRTSPDHGTAFNIAWQNKADQSSMKQAFNQARKISSNRNKK